MSNDHLNPDPDKYFNDPVYRKKIRDQKEKLSASGNKNASLKKKIIIGLGATAGFILIFITFYTIYLFRGLPSIEELENPKTAIASVVMSRDGAILDRYFIENRTWVRIDDISPNVINALVATEDHRFYEHWGMDMVRTLAIPYHLIRLNPQGGSTISQQLARNLYRQIGQEFSVARKFREMITSVQIEKNYTKREIIEMYLNTVEYSNSAFGIESAAQTHFSKPATDLNILEAATLVGTLNAPGAFNPRLNPERSKARRNVVLAQMQKHDFIPRAVFENMINEPISLDYQPPSRSNRQSRYFGEYVRLRVQDWANENGYDLYQDGLTIHTTIDSRMQRHAERSLRENLDTLQVQFENEWTSRGGSYMNRFWQEFPGFLRSFIVESDRYKNGYAKYQTNQQSVVIDSLMMDHAFVDSVKRARTRLEAGFVAIDPNNGSVLAWIGGSNFGQRQFDHVHQSRRQAGSTFKPFVYAVAIDNGYMPYHKFSKYPVSFVAGANQRPWTPKDPTVPTGPEMISLREGLARSLNNITVRLLPEISGVPGTNRLYDLDPGARKIAEMAQNFGIDMSNEAVVPSIALGTANTSLLDLVSAYTTFANQGVHIDPIAITRIEDKEGNVLIEWHPEFRQEVISAETAYIMLDMMRGVISGGEWGHGTGVRLRNLYNVRQDVAGKTGTTQNSADNWFVGVMPHIVMGAWVGGEDRRIRFPNSLGIGQGARSALPIVGQFINNVTSDPEVPWSYDAFTPPPGFIMPVDPDSRRDRNAQDERRGTIGW